MTEKPDKNKMQNDSLIQGDGSAALGISHKKTTYCLPFLDKILELWTREHKGMSVNSVDSCLVNLIFNQIS